MHACTRIPIILMILAFSEIEQSGKISILTLWFYFALILLCGILVPLSIYFIRGCLQTRMVERKILRFLKTDGNVAFRDISNEIGFSRSKILEITRLAIEKGKISGVITFDETGFISETELRREFSRDDLPLKELVTEISKIDSPEVKKISPQIAADSRLIRSLKIPTSDVAIAGGEVMDNIKPVVKREAVSEPITKHVGERLGDMEKEKEKKPGIEVVTKEQQDIFRSLKKHWKRIAKARRQK